MGNPKAKYTISLQEALEIKPTLLSGIINLDTDEHTTKFINMLVDMYWNWEIAGETIGEFENIVKHKVGARKDYYIELLNAYEVQINMLDGNKIETISDDTNDNLDYDLPRSDTAQERPSSKNKGSTHATSTMKGGNQVALKEQYMRMLRSVYYKFSKELQPCFIEMFE